MFCHVHGLPSPPGGILTASVPPWRAAVLSRWASPSSPCSHPGLSAHLPVPCSTQPGSRAEAQCHVAPAPCPGGPPNWQSTSVVYVRLSAESKTSRLEGIKCSHKRPAKMGSKGGSGFSPGNDDNGSVPPTSQPWPCHCSAGLQVTGGWAHIPVSNTQLTYEAISWRDDAPLGILLSVSILSKRKLNQNGLPGEQA